MYCKNCGKEINDGAKFCPICGAEQSYERNEIQDRKAKKISSKMPAIVGICAGAAALVIILLLVSVILPSQHYDKAVKALDNEDYSLAVSEFDAAGKYKDAEDRKATAEHARKIVDDGVVTIGKWRGEEIEWRVLDVKNGMALLISKDILTTRQYDGLEKQYGKRLLDFDIDWENVKVTWADSEIREWLNSDFIYEVFSESEKNNILESYINNPSNEEYGTDGGKNTKDKIFLLSIDEMDRYFKDDDDRIAKYRMSEEDLDYIIEKHEEDWGYDDEMLEELRRDLENEYIGKKKGWWWWLRSPGGSSDRAAVVDGSVNLFGNTVYNFDFGVRPALYLDLKV